MNYTKVSNDLLRNDDLKANTKILLLVILSYENKEDGYAYPSHKRLIKETGLSKNTLLKSLNELEEKGYIKREKEKGENNKYYINSSIKIDTSSSIKIDTSNDETSIKNDTRGSIKIDTLELLNNNNIYKEKKESKTSLDKMIEAYTENDLLVEAIKDFIKMRKTIKKPLTDRALKGILNKLDKLSDDDLEKIEILEQSIIKCWQDVFELKNKKAPTGIGTKENKLVNCNNSICSNGQNYSSRGREIL